MQRKSYIKENIFGKSDSKSIISFRKKKKKKSYLILILWI